VTHIRIVVRLTLTLDGAREGAVRRAAEEDLGVEVGPEAPTADVLAAAVRNLVEANTLGLGIPIDVLDATASEVDDGPDRRPVAHATADPTGPTTSTVETVEIGGPDAQARGRNGWFRPRQVCLQRGITDRSIVVSVQSSRAYGDLAPIHLSLPLDDARRIHDALGRQLDALTAEPSQERTP